MEKCPICNASLTGHPEPTPRDARLIPCPNCGTYEISGSAEASLPKWQNEHQELVSRLSHRIWKMGGPGDPPFVCSDHFDETEHSKPISIQEQADNLMLELDSATQSPGHQVQLLVSSTWAGRIGAADSSNVRFIAESLIAQGLIEEVPVDNGRAYRITFSGYQYLDELKRGQRDSRKAFFASQWGDPRLDDAFRNVISPAVQQTGFRLFRLDHEPKAGLIDDRMRVEIRTSRFLIADLTHDNSGAYWEAGFAEGLGKPVIFTCERSVFEKRETHFDTNHHLTVVWDEDDSEGTSERLKATIRATLPDDAILEDPDQPVE